MHFEVVDSLTGARRVDLGCAISAANPRHVVSFDVGRQFAVREEFEFVGLPSLIRFRVYERVAHGRLKTILRIAFPQLLTRNRKPGRRRSLEMSVIHNKQRQSSLLLVYRPPEERVLPHVHQAGNARCAAEGLGLA
jgi:hypothetical protein